MTGHRSVTGYRSLIGQQSALGTSVARRAEHLHGSEVQLGQNDHQLDRWARPGLGLSDGSALSEWVLRVVG